MEKLGGIQTKPLQNYGNLKKSKQNIFFPRLKQVVRFIEGDEKMTMIRDEDGDDSVSMSTYSQSECQKNPRQKRPLGCFSE
jgi:hypothetical protein